MSEPPYAISFNMVKVSERSPSLDGEGEGVRMGSQGEPLMQKEREKQGNEEAERILNLVHSTASMLRAKDAIKSLPPIAGDDFKYDSSDSFGDASNREDTDKASMNLGGAVGPSSSTAAQNSDLKQNQDVDELKQLVSAQNSNPVSLDDNKKGEKDVNIQVSKVIVPAITTSKPPALDIIDLINLAAAELKLKEQMKKIDDRIEKGFGSTATQDQSVKYFTQLKPITLNDMKLGREDKVARGAPLLTHMFFADDTYIYYKAKVDEVDNVTDLLKFFERASGKKGDVHRAGRGTTVSIMEDPWLPYRDPYIHTNHEAIQQKMVDVLMDREQGSWDSDLVHDIFEERDAQLIPFIPLNTVEHDSWFWKYDKLGTYTVKSPYAAIQEA
ncbi:hypothetical protein AgCh_028547 [Apium graveolens]